MPLFIRQEFQQKLPFKNARAAQYAQFFSDVLHGKKVSTLFVERFIGVMGLSREEAQFFRVLVMFNQADTAEEREIHFNQLISLNRTPKRVLEKSIYIYYRNWYNSVIRALLHIHDFKDNYTDLAKKVFPPITVFRQSRFSRKAPLL